MTKRLLPHTLLLLAATATLSACPGDDTGPAERLPYVDSWEEVSVLPAAQFGLLSIGDRISSDNYSNRGNVEVRYVEGTNAITIEMQRFTVAEDEDEAALNFDRMQYWGYSLSAPEKPADDNVLDRCDNTEGDDLPDRCYIRAYYDGLFQPSRDGANFRVTVPAGWAGDLFVVTADNLEEGVDTYPDRSDVIIDGLNGNLEVDMDSGNIDLKIDPNIPHYAGCEDSQACEDSGFMMGCGCTTPTNVTIANKTGQASNINVDVGSADNWYTMQLENNGTFSPGDDFLCEASIACDAFASCELDPAYTADPAQERAEINFPDNGLATRGAGIRIALTSEDCANIKYVNGPDDHGIEELPEEKRGVVTVCAGCLDSI